MVHTHSVHPQHLCIFILRGLLWLYLSSQGLAMYLYHNRVVCTSAFHQYYEPFDWLRVLFVYNYPECVDWEETKWRAKRKRLAPFPLDTNDDWIDLTRTFNFQGHKFICVAKYGRNSVTNNTTYKSTCIKSTAYCLSIAIANQRTCNLFSMFLFMKIGGGGMDCQYSLHMYDVCGIYRFRCFSAYNNNHSVGWKWCITASMREREYERPT